MNSTLFKSICLRFTSGNSIPVERAHVNVDEMLALETLCERTIGKLKKRLELATYTLENSGLLESTHQNLQYIELKFPDALRMTYRVLERGDGVVQIKEIKPLLELITKASFSENHLKALINSHQGAVRHITYPTTIPKFK